MPRTSLLFHRDFRLLWIGDSVSQVGTWVTQTSVPLLAALVLAATPLQMGLLTAAQEGAFLLIGLPAGVWVDRMRRRPLMLGADLGRAALLLSVPIGWWLGVLTIWQLIVVGLLVGVLTVFFDVAYQSYLPVLVGRAHLVEGNSKLQASMSVAMVSGPALGGGLTQLVGAANAVLTDALSYLVSALCLWRIRTVEPARDRSTRRGLVPEIAEGLRFVFGNRLLRGAVGTTSAFNFFSNVYIAVTILLLTRDLRLAPGLVGLVMAAGGVGGVLGAVTAGRITGSIGQARTIVLSAVVAAISSVLLPLAEPGWRVLLFPAGYLISGFGTIVYNVAQVSFRQAISPDRLLGRINASVRFVVWGTLPLGGLAGGALGQWIGVRETVWIGAIGTALAPLFVLCSPLRRLRDLPSEPVAESTTSESTAPETSQSA
ncbi:MAG TPA: MFS transporter [Pseudonocardiaceae bacterium]|nr:MFS transporter [Pseudonocardiaceae bacterium]